jgi:hypothetical protein
MPTADEANFQQALYKQLSIDVSSVFFEHLI